MSDPTDWYQDWNVVTGPLKVDYVTLHIDPESHDLQVHLECEPCHYDIGPEHAEGVRSFVNAWADEAKRRVLACTCGAKLTPVHLTSCPVHGRDSPQQVIERQKKEIADLRASLEMARDMLANYRCTEPPRIGSVIVRDERCGLDFMLNVREAHAERGPHREIVMHVTCDPYIAAGAKP